MASDTLVIDKFAFVEKLISRGFDRNQAEAVAEAVSDIALAQLVTKSDLRDALGHLKIDLLKFMFGAMAAQTALIVALVELLKS